MTSRRLLLIRHGETDLNAAGHYVSTSDPDLSRSGRRQVTELATTLGAWRIDHIISSPKLRCRSTAEAIAALQTAPVDVVVDDRLVELGFGQFERKSPADLDKLGLTSTLLAWRQGTPPRYPEHAETFDEAATRISPVFDQPVSSSFQTEVKSGHSHAPRLPPATHMTPAPPDAPQRLRLGHARIAEVQWEDGAPRIVALNTSDIDGDA